MMNGFDPTGLGASMSGQQQQVDPLHAFIASLLGIAFQGSMNAPGQNASSPFGSGLGSSIIGGGSGAGTGGGGTGDPGTGGLTFGRI